MSMGLARSQLARRELLRLGGYASLAALLSPSLAFASVQPGLMPNVTALVSRWVGPGKFPGIVTALGLPGQPTQFVARGSEGFLDADPVTPDSLFSIIAAMPVIGLVIE